MWNLEQNSQIFFPHNNLIICLLSITFSFAFISVNTDSFFSYQVEEDIAFVTVITFCGALLSTGDSNLSLIPKYCVSSFQWSSQANCWTLKSQKINMNITSLLPTTCNALFKTKRNSSIWQTNPFHPLTVFNASEITPFPL